MKTITFITSNALKTKEVRAILGDPTLFTLIYHSLELPELQASPEEIVINKCETAATIVPGPVLVEDTMLTFKSLNGLPGPYIKSFITQIGLEGLVRILADFEDKSAQASCTFAYAEAPNQKIQLFTGTIDGKIVPPRSTKKTMDWGDIFQPDGYEITYAMMDQNEKNKISHRYKALMQLQDFLIKKLDIQKIKE